jgi:formamidopyrimidine-DNA glycosylase
MMIEIPEALHIAKQITEHLQGKRIVETWAAASPHKFAWYQGSPDAYPHLLNGKEVQSARPVGGMIEISFGDAYLVLSEGAYPLFLPHPAAAPAKHQLLITFSDETALAVSVRMYGGILAFSAGMADNTYYLLAKEKPSPLSAEFDRVTFDALLNSEGMEKLSAKAFLATEQRIPGLGNGTLQDVLYDAGIHPKSRMADLAPEKRESLFISIKRVLKEMADGGGRDTETDLFGNPGNYRTRCSKLTEGQPCSRCGQPITKASYMGGSIYFCPGCQPL